MDTNFNILKDPLPNIIKQIALPASIGLIFNTLYNVVDTFWAGEISTDALAAMGLSFPVFFIILSIGMGLGTGTTALLSIELGKENEQGAVKLSAQACAFALLNSIVLPTLGILIAPKLFEILGANDQYLEYALEYINTIFFGTFFIVINNILNAFLTARGDTKSYRNLLIVGFFLNLGLDPLFLRGGFGIPAMGLRGVALATVVIQVFGTIYMITRVRKYKALKGAVLKDYIPNRKYFIELFKQGFPASLNMMMVSIGLLVITYFAGRFGKEVVAAFGIGIRIEQIALLPTMGLNIAALTVVGQNYGAKQYHRVTETWRLCTIYGIVIMTIGSILVYIFAPQLLNIFSDDPVVNSIAIKYLRIVAFFFILYIPLNISISTLQGLKRPNFAIFLAMFRKIILPLPLMYIFAVSLGHGPTGIWWAICIVNTVTSIFTIIYIKRKFKTLLH